MSRRMTIACALAATFAMLAAACDDGDAPAPPPTARPLPSPVAVRPEPDGVTLADPAFEALPGARAEYGRLGGAVYRIELPDAWNGRLVLFMHGFESLAPEASVSAPDFRHYLITHGFAWGASSFSSTSLIPGRAADETAALWDYFSREHGRPARSYVSGLSMGGMAAQIAAERYGDRYDGALALCGSAGNEAGAKGQADFVAAGAYVAGVTQAEFAAMPDRARVIDDRILPALRDPAAHARFEDIVIALTGGPRPFAREGLHLEEETNWSRARLQLSAGLISNAGVTYDLGAGSGLASGAFNRDAIRMSLNDAVARAFYAGNEATGDLRIPLLTMHTTGDGQVPVSQAQILQRRVAGAGKGDLLVQRLYADASHCGFSTPEWEDGLKALVAWVEDGHKPAGDDVLATDLTGAGSRFILAPRPGSAAADALPGASARATLRGTATLDGAPLDARWLGAVVLRDGLVTPCDYVLAPVDGGRYEVTLFAGAESAGCGAAGAQVLLWTFARGQRMFAARATAWPGDGATATFDPAFSSNTPDGAMPPVSQFNGEVYTRDGDHVPPGSRIEARVGGTLCGVASTRGVGNYAGYILNVAGPDTVAGCAKDAPLTFTIDGAPAVESAANHLGEGEGFDLTVR